MAPITDVPWPQQHYDLTALGAQTTGTGLTVAVVDSGVDAVHPQLRDAVRTGADMLVRGGDGREDCVGHGTAVASIIAGRPAAGTPFQGLAPGVTILPVRVSERTDVEDRRWPVMPVMPVISATSRPASGPPWRVNHGRQ